MKNKISFGTMFSLFFTLFSGCVDPYAPPATKGASNYLVVSGFLNSGDSTCSITLSRSLLLSDTDVPTPVTDATVSLEDQNGNSFNLPYQADGIYANSTLIINSQLTYRLHIVTSNSESYYSDYVPVIQTPVIDTVGWAISQIGSNVPTLNIYVSSRGTTDQSPYYFWNFEETWKYSTPYQEELKIMDGQIVTNYDSNQYCWRTIPSTAILISSTKQLSQNVVDQFALNSVPANSIKLYDGYSILVTQLSLTQEAFQYWQQLKATTENLGTIFGPLPSQFSGNIHSATSPSEPVFGYFSASTVSEKRIFIRPSDFNAPLGHIINGYEDCTITAVPAKDIFSSLGGNVIASSYGVGPVGYNLTSLYCVDCRLQGGSNKQPSYWPH